MAVVTRPSGVFPYVKNSCCRPGSSQNGRLIRSAWQFTQTQLCTVALSLSIFNSVRLPGEAFKYGTIPYLIVYSFWMLVAGFPITLLQLAMGQLSQQDTVGVWRAVPVLRGVGHLKILTSYLCCVYYMMYIALSAAYIIWIGKGSFPLKDCTKLQITPHGYENKMNASECFNTTFLAPLTEYPQYIGVMAILIFLLWFFTPILLYRLRKSLKITLTILAPSIVVIAIVLCTFTSNLESLSFNIVSSWQWKPFFQPYIWLSALVQALMSTQIISGYLISAGGTVYRYSDVRWTSAFVISSNLLAGWLWVFMWESLSGNGTKDISFVSVLVLIYQSAVIDKRTKEWPLIAFSIVFISGVITLLTLLYPIYDKLHRVAGDHWRLFATASSAIGTGLTVAVLARGLDVADVLDELVVPVLAVFTAVIEVVGFIVIYGWINVSFDIEFLTGSRFPYIWIASWWTTPILMLGVTGWWLRDLLRSTWDQPQTLWPMVAVFIGILVIMMVTAAVAVAKEEQFNLLSKVASAFKPSRLWGPEEPMTRYVWISQRYDTEAFGNDNDAYSENNYADIIYTKDNEKKFNEDWMNHIDLNPTTYKVYTKTGDVDKDFELYNEVSLNSNHAYLTPRNLKLDDKFRSPNICLAKCDSGGPLECNCNRHFTLNVPKSISHERTTSL